MKFGRSGMFSKIVTLNTERSTGKKGTPSRYSNTRFQKKITQRQPGQDNAERSGKVRSVTSYRCKAPRSIWRRSERSTLVATDNGPCTPVYPLVTNEQAINRHEKKNSHSHNHAMRSRETMTTTTRLPGIAITATVINHLALLQL